MGHHLDKRFDVCVWNYKRLDLFLDNFGRIRNFDPSRDRITIVSCSPSAEESQAIRDFELCHGLSVRYLTRENRGIDQLARCDYFTGRVGSETENLAYAFIFQMQEHYLDTESPVSRWGTELDHAPKSDTVPDGMVFDLDHMEALAGLHELDGFFADRANPCYVELDARRFVAPCGGNWTLRTDRIAEEAAQHACRQLIASCDNTYPWAVYAEYMWGPIFFHEGRRFWDLKRDRLYEKFPREDFYLAPDDYRGLMRTYQRPLAIQRARGGFRRTLGYLAHLRRSAVNAAD